MEIDMKRSYKIVYYPAMISLAMAAGMAVAQTPSEVMEQTMTQEQRVEGEQFKNLGEEDQLRHRVNENTPEKAKKVREMKENQEGKKSQHQYRYEEKSPGSHMQQSGSRMGGGGGGGGRR